jgi:hypothetical protein
MPAANDGIINRLEETTDNDNDVVEDNGEIIPKGQYWDSDNDNTDVEDKDDDDKKTSKVTGSRDASSLPEASLSRPGRIPDNSSEAARQATQQSNPEPDQTVEESRAENLRNIAPPPECKHRKLTAAVHLVILTERHSLLGFLLLPPVIVSKAEGLTKEAGVVLAQSVAMVAQLSQVMAVAKVVLHQHLSTPATPTTMLLMTKTPDLVMQLLVMQPLGTQSLATQSLASQPLPTQLLTIQLLAMQPPPT